MAGETWEGGGGARAGGSESGTRVLAYNKHISASGSYQGGSDSLQATPASVAVPRPGGEAIGLQEQLAAEPAARLDGAKG